MKNYFDDLHGQVRGNHWPRNKIRKLEAELRSVKTAVALLINDCDGGRPAAETRGRGSSSDWVDKEDMQAIQVGDCLEILPQHTGIDLIVADPPYNIGVDYGDGERADRLPPASYGVWCADWIKLCAEALRPGGSLWIISGQEHGAKIDMAIEWAGLVMRNRITWHETFGVYCHKKFGRTSRPIYYAIKPGAPFTFNAGSVRIPSDRQKYGDKRANPAGKIMGDVWSISRVCGTFRERVAGVPTQLPEQLVQRIVEVSSQPGDTVLDPFAGSGTVPAVASRLGRRGVGIERNPEYAAIATARLAAVDT